MNNKIILQDAARVCSAIDFSGLEGRTVLVTGASGMIGTYLVACLCHLVRAGARIRILGQVFSDPPEHFQEFKECEIIRMNLADNGSYRNLPHADFIVHCAGYAQPARFMANPAATVLVNTAATAALLECLNAGGRFLFISSSEVYSGLKKSVLQETDIGCTTPAHPRASYIEGKRCGETICNAYRLKGVAAISARVALAYGPGTRIHDTRAMNSFIEKALREGRIEMLDAGHAVRTYCYVADIAEILWRILMDGIEPVYNVGGHSVVTIAELAELIGRKTNVKVGFPSTSAEVPGAPEEVRLDLSHVESEFGKRGYVPFDEGLSNTIEWQKDLYKN